MSIFYPISSVDKKVTFVSMDTENADITLLYSVYIRTNLYLSIYKLLNLTKDYELTLFKISNEHILVRV